MLYGLVPLGGRQSLNQTYGWGTESGDAFGSGTVWPCCVQMPTRARALARALSRCRKAGASPAARLTCPAHASAHCSVPRDMTRVWATTWATKSCILTMSSAPAARAFTSCKKKCTPTKL